MVDKKGNPDSKLFRVNSGARKGSSARRPWLRPVILATWEAETWRIKV
jgi:hypothetical protein